MHKNLAITIALLDGVGLVAGSGALASDLDDMFIKALEDRSIPAMTALTIREGKIAEQVVHGVRAAGSADAARLNDQWHIGSDSKAMTASMIASLVGPMQAKAAARSR
jgi:CubicO group peptidase (beta-lactamase class C family)